METEKIKELSIAMEDLLFHQNEVKKEKAIFDKKVKVDSARISELKTLIDIQKSSLTKEALKEFEKTNNKSLLGGIGIREKDTVNYTYDSVKALEYAKKTGTCLLLDKKAFEAIAKPLNLDFVKIEEEKVATVAFPKKIIID